MAGEKKRNGDPVDCKSEKTQRRDREVIPWLTNHVSLPSVKSE